MCTVGEEMTRAYTVKHEAIHTPDGYKSAKTRRNLGAPASFLNRRQKADTVPSLRRAFNNGGVLGIYCCTKILPRKNVPDISTGESNLLGAIHDETCGGC